MTCDQCPISLLCLGNQLALHGQTGMVCFHCWRFFTAFGECTYALHCEPRTQRRHQHRHYHFAEDPQDHHAQLQYSSCHLCGPAPGRPIYDIWGYDDHGVATLLYQVPRPGDWGYHSRFL